MWYIYKTDEVKYIYDHKILKIVILKEWIP